MVGTHLTIIVNSNDDGCWDYGELSIWGTDINDGNLSGRDFNNNNWEGSIFPAAGINATMDYFEDGEEGQPPIATGFRFGVEQDAVAGDWFIIDYNATSVGTCRVAFFDGDVSWDEPLYEMSFTHVPSRDLNEDHVVNFADFAAVGLYWGTTDCTDPDGCGKVDLDSDEIIDINDLGPFVEYWLERTD
jgi:hypothetical protein